MPPRLPREPCPPTWFMPQLGQVCPEGAPRSQGPARGLLTSALAGYGLLDHSVDLRGKGWGAGEEGGGGW